MGAKVLRYAGLRIGMVVGALDPVFAAGYALTDWDVIVGLAVTASWAVPTVVLCAYALVRPDPAIRVLAVIAAAATGYGLVDAFSDVIPSDEWGPVTTVVDLALGLTITVLAVKRPRPAGIMLAVVAIVQLVGTVANIVLHETGTLPPGPGLVSPPVLVWMLLVGTLVVLSDDSSQHRPSTADTSMVGHRGASGRLGLRMAFRAPASWPDPGQKRSGQMSEDHA